MKLKALCMLVSVSLSTMPFGVSAGDIDSMTVQNQTDNGAPSFVTGTMGSMTQKTAKEALKKILASESSYGFTGKEDFEVKRQWVDSLGKSHTQFSQKINGLKVYGTSMILHADVSTNSLADGSSTSDSAAADVYAVSGSLAIAPAQKSSFSAAASNDSVLQVTTAASLIGDISGEPELAYVYLESGKTKLAWRVEVSWNNGGSDFGRDYVFYDVDTFEVLARHAQIHSAKSWRTHTLDGQGQGAAPGRLLCTNNQNCGGNAAAQRAHDGAAKVYDYYQDKFGRDSLNNRGLTLVSSVELGDVNAYWTGSQMMYGAESAQFNDFTSDFDIIGHELTHGLTQFTANLVYQNASGALNEAWSDILGIAAEAYNNGRTTSSWLLGDGLLKNNPGAALRYMNNPTRDNYSKDWWPERIPYVGIPTNQNDRGGVHGNSGIANLAFVLLVDGGSHPRNKSTAQVPRIGMAKAEQIFYRALTTYFTQNTNFAGARAGTAQAAQDLYGAAEKTAVETAWCAVGVGTCPSGTPGDGNELQNGQTVTGITAASKVQTFYTIDVPANASSLVVETGGGTGDADLYVRFNSKPTLNTSDCSSTTSTSSEICTINNVRAGTYHVMVEAWNAISGVALRATYR